MEASDDEDDEDEDDGDEDNSSGDQGSVSSASVSFDRRDLSWQGRVKGATTGKVHRITRCVPMRDENKKTYTPAAFERRKAQIKREVQKWMEQKDTTMSVNGAVFYACLTEDCIGEHWGSH